MAAVLGRIQIQIKEEDCPMAAIPNDPIAKLMYYFHCICACVEVGDDYTIRRLRDYENYLSLSEEEEAKLFVLCLAASPEKLEDCILFPANDDTLGDRTNKFLELSAVDTKVVITESLLTGGQQKKVCKVMAYSRRWIELYYYNPLRALERRMLRPPQPTAPVCPPPTSQLSISPAKKPSAQENKSHQIQQEQEITTVSEDQPVVITTQVVRVNNRRGEEGNGGIVFAVLTTVFLATFGCWWALPCSITGIILGITSEGESAQGKMSISCTVCSWITGIGIVLLVGAILGYIYITA